MYSYDETFMYSNIDERYNNTKLYIKNIEFINSYFILNQSPLLLEVGTLPVDKKNSLLYVGNKESEEKNQLHINLQGNNKNIKVTAIAALAPYVTWPTPNTVLKLVATDGKITKDVFEKEIEPRKFYKIDEMIDLSEFSGNVKLKLLHLSTEGKETGWGTMTVLNTEITTFN